MGSVETPTTSVAVTASQNSPSNNNRSEQSEYIMQLNEQAWILVDQDRSRAIEMGEETLELSQKGIFAEDSFQLGIGQSLTIQAYVNHRLAKFENSLSMALRALDIFENVPKSIWVLRLYNTLAINYQELGDKPTSLLYLVEMLKSSQEVGDEKHIAGAFHNLGLYFSDIGDYEKSADYYKKSLAKFRSIDDPWGQALTLANLGKNFVLTDALQKASVCFAEALQLCEGLSRPDGEAYVRHNMGSVLQKLGKTDSAEAYFKQSYELADSAGDEQIKIMTMLSLGQLQTETGQLELSRQSLDTALESSQDAGYKVYTFKVHKALADLYKELGEFKTAVSHLEQYQTVKETVFNEESQQKVNNLEVLHRTEAAQKEAEQYRLRKDELELMVKKRTSQLARRSEELADTLEREQNLARELEQTLEREMYLNKTKSHVIEVVSHEFRTPLAIINNSCGLLDKHYDKLKPEKKEELHSRIRESIFSLTHLLDDTVFINTAQTGKLRAHWGTYTLSEFCTDLSEQLKTKLKTPRIQFIIGDIQPDVMIQTDYDKTSQIIFNLISNALKYSPPESPVKVTLGQRGEKLIVAVTDKGIGVPKDELEKIFDIFYRAKNIDHQRGLGLGLNIAKQLTEILQGQIVAHSDEGEVGSTFILQLPLEPKIEPQVLVEEIAEPVAV